jgi:hypothetical protein
MLLKCHYHLHLLVESKGVVVDQRVEKDNNLDIFEMIANTIKPTIKLMNRKLLIFKHYQMDVKEIKCPLKWWEKHESMFLIIGYYVKQILKIVGSQIEIEKKKILIKIFTSFRRCHLQ